MGIINAIDGCGGVAIGYGAPELVTGGRDGCVRLWDIRVKEPVLALEPGMCCIFFHAYAYTHLYDQPLDLTSTYPNMHVHMYVM